MRLTSPAIQRLLTASERTVVDSASASAIKDMTAARLRSKVARARRLKDKYDGLARTRARAGRGKTASRGSAKTDAETMRKKAEVFGEVLRRFEKQLDTLERRARKQADPAARKARVRKAVAKVRRRVAEQEGHPAPEAIAETPDPQVADVVAANTRRRAVSRASKAARVAQTLDASHVTRAHGHIGARTQRRQAKRDSR